MHNLTPILRFSVTHIKSIMTTFFPQRLSSACRCLTIACSHRATETIGCQTLPGHASRLPTCRFHREKGWQWQASRPHSGQLSALFSHSAWHKPWQKEKKNTRSSYCLLSQACWTGAYVTGAALQLDSQKLRE